MSMTVHEHFRQYVTEMGLFPPDEEAMHRLVVDGLFEGHAPRGWSMWSEARRDIAIEQLTYKFTGIDVGDIDGLVGPATRNAREVYAHFMRFGEMPPPMPDRDLGQGSTAAKVSSPFPADNEKALAAFYGSAPIRVDQMVKVPCPWRLAVVLVRVYERYVQMASTELRLDFFSGDFIPRRMRGGTRWSAHARAIAWDFDDTRNQLRWGRDRAAFARPEYNDWWEIWEAQGFTSLGRTQNRDFMHVQATA